MCSFSPPLFRDHIQESSLMAEQKKTSHTGRFRSPHSGSNTGITWGVAKHAFHAQNMNIKVLLSFVRPTPRWAEAEASHLFPRASACVDPGHVPTNQHWVVVCNRFDFLSGTFLCAQPTVWRMQLDDICNHSFLRGAKILL